MPNSPEGKPSGGRRAERRAEVARALMEAGLSVIAAKGLDRAKVVDITQAAGVGKGTFFTHFASKDAFVVALVDRVLWDLARRVRPLGLTPDDAQALLAGVATAHLRYFQLRPAAAGLLVQSCRLPAPAGLQAVERINQHVRMLAEMLIPACSGLGWPLERCRDLALMVLSTSCGFLWFAGALNLADDLPMPLMERLGAMLARGLDQGA